MRCLPITEASQVAAARRLVTHAAQRLDWQETDIGKLALLTTEMATNLVKHAVGGQLLVRSLVDVCGIELLALDKGPGMRNVQECLRDGYSTSGSLGTGLGAICRLATHWDIYSVYGSGTVLLVQIVPLSWQATPAPRLSVGAVCLPIAGETVCGDGWAVLHQAHCSLVMVADGLGHGLQAAEAAQKAMRVLDVHRLEAPTALLQYMHAGLQHTRGAAIAVAAVDYQRQETTFAGVGNIAGTIVMAEKTHRMMSHNGIVGHQIRKVQALTYPWSEHALLVMHSDGLGSRWDLTAYHGLFRRHPSVIAGVLYRDFGRGRDDVTVVVVREHRE